MTREKPYYLTVVEVCDLMQVSQSTAYKLMRQLNNELKKKGYITQAGRIPRCYLMERCNLRGEAD